MGGFRGWLEVSAVELQVSGLRFELGQLGVLRFPGELRRPTLSAWTLSLRGCSSPLNPLAHCGGDLHLSRNRTRRGSRV